MAWVKLDDGFHANPKAIKAGWPARGLYTAALSYCGHYLTDGRIPGDWIASQVGAKPLIGKLVEVGLVEALEDGDYLIPDYLEYNPAKAVVEARRAKDSKRKLKGIQKDSARNPQDPLARARDGRGRAQAGTGLLGVKDEVLEKKISVFDELCDLWPKTPTGFKLKEAQDAWFAIRPDDELAARIIAVAEKQIKAKDWAQGKPSHEFSPSLADWLAKRPWEHEAPQSEASAIFANLGAA